MTAKTSFPLAVPYRPEIDGLRGVAVLIVLLFHVRLGCPGGEVGVDVFFVISGFLITSLIQQDLDRGEFQFLQFWERRVRRLVPAMVVTLLLVLTYGYFLVLPQDYALLGKMTAFQVAGLSNVAHWLTTGYFSPNAKTLPLLHTWSLAVEEQFCLILPGVLWLMRNWMPRKRLLLVGLATFASWGLGLWATHSHAAAAYYLLPTRVWEMLLGSCLALSHGRLESSRVREAVSALGLGGILVSTLTFEETTPIPGISATLPTVSAAMFLAANRGMLTRSGSWLTCRPLVFVGQISYSLYLLHWPIIVFTTDFFWKQIDVRWKCGMLAAALIGACLSWWLVETPSRQRKWLESRRSLSIAAGLSLSLLLCLGITVYQQQGFPSRFSDQVLRYTTPEPKDRFYTKVKLPQVKSGELLPLGVATGDVRCLIWGDSHAMVMLTGLHQALTNCGIRGEAAVHPATVPLLGPTGRIPAEVTDSATYTEAVVNHARQLRVQAVFLTAYWREYVDKPGFQERLDRTVAELRASGIQVVIIRDVPDLPVSAPSWLAREVILGHGLEDVGVPLELHRQRNSAVDRVLLAQQGDSVFVIDPAPWLTDSKGLCRVEMDGIALYLDDDHLSQAGSLRLVPLFEEIISRVLPSETSVQGR